MLDREFFRADALTLAPALVGKLLVRTFPDGSEKRLRITETEAYCGVEDTACHAHKSLYMIIFISLADQKERSDRASSFYTVKRTGMQYISV